MSFLSVALGALGVSLSGHAPLNPHSQEDLTIKETMEAIRKKYDLPALGGAIVTMESTQVFVTGVRKRGAEETIQPDDRWHLGSNTKAMTATLAALLVQQGKLKWTTTLGEVFPYAKKEYQNVTLEMLLTHRGGFPPPEQTAPKGTSILALHNLSSSPHEARAEYAKKALAQEPYATPGTQTVYSNMGYILAGALIEKKAGKPWEILMQDLLFHPLEMKSAGFGPMIEPFPHLSTGQPLTPSHWTDNPPLIGPAGAVHASLSDYAKFLRLHLGAGNLLHQETLHKLHTPPEGEDYAFGWIVVPREWAGGTALTHAGSNTLNFTVVWLALRREFGVIAVTNQGGEKSARACDEVASALIKKHLSNNEASRP